MEIGNLWKFPLTGWEKKVYEKEYRHGLKSAEPLEKKEGEILTKRIRLQDTMTEAMVWATIVGLIVIPIAAVPYGGPTMFAGDFLFGVIMWLLVGMNFSTLSDRVHLARRKGLELPPLRTEVNPVTAYHAYRAQRERDEQEAGRKRRTEEDYRKMLEHSMRIVALTRIGVVGLTAITVVSAVFWQLSALLPAIMACMVFLVYLVTIQWVGNLSAHMDIRKKMEGIANPPPA